MPEPLSPDPAPISEGPSHPTSRYEGLRQAVRRWWPWLAARPVTLIVGVLIAAVVLVWMIRPTASASRITTVLTEERKLYQQMEATVTPLDSHWDASGAASRYAEGISRIDTAGCPDDFRLAFLKYVQAWNAVVREKRSNAWAGLIIRGFLFGKEKGTALGDVDEAVKRAQQEWYEVERSALKYRATRSR